ncbi:LAGLIDADG family homing endonuclease [Halorubrum sp. Hd13]|uniref:LAGLIDADG family homing endonuclease n=1 Tax=Halorubrum sp. Hd13 TaxID=1480728 RepID=UPI0011407E92|nr:LAGLIDADG family homing endonuclease [Halorubrum sp. Hd13]
MEEHWMWYLSGVVDTVGTFTTKIQKSSQRKIGYKIIPVVYLTRPNNIESIFGMVDEYTDKMGVRYRIDETKTTNRLVIENIESIRNFIEPIIDGFVQQRERAEFFLDEVLPAFEDRTHEKEEFMELIQLADELRDYPIERGSSKYDADYFREEWDVL